MTGEEVIEWIEETCAAYCINRPFSIIDSLKARCQADSQAPVDMLLFCPRCHAQHVDAPEKGELISGGPNAGRVRKGWSNPPHRSHLCHACGFIWRPADIATNGVAEIKTKGKADSAVAQPTIASSVDAFALDALVAAGHVSQAKVDEARRVASTVGGIAPSVALSGGVLLALHQIAKESDGAEFLERAKGLLGDLQPVVTCILPSVERRGRDVPTFEQLACISLGWLLEAACNNADPALDKLQASLTKHVEDSVMASRTHFGVSS